MGVKENTVRASEFRAHCLRLIDEVVATGKSVLITQRGRPVARLVPVEMATEALGGIWKGRGKTLGEIVDLDTSSEWDASK
jgi:prevent-host-death family protein